MANNWNNSNAPHGRGRGFTTLAWATGHNGHNGPSPQSAGPHFGNGGGYGAAPQFVGRAPAASVDKPCFNCGAPDHWARECPHAHGGGKGGGYAPGAPAYAPPTGMMHPPAT
eukprot:COSAG04_NODE_17873_length_457_cov_0.673184_1_plen_111_part_10